MGMKVESWRVYGMFEFYRKQAAAKGQTKITEHYRKLQQQLNNANASEMAKKHLGYGDFIHLERATGIDYTQVVDNGNYYIDGSKANKSAARTETNIQLRGKVGLVIKKSHTKYDVKTVDHLNNEELSRMLQWRLNRRGKGLTVDGIIGEKTISAMKEEGLLTRSYSETYIDLGSLNAIQKKAVIEYVKTGKGKKLVVEAAKPEPSKKPVEKKPEAKKPEIKKPEVKKPAPKPASKTTPKPSPKPSPKPTAKPIIKPSPKPPVKPSPKPTVQPTPSAEGIKKKRLAELEKQKPEIQALRFGISSRGDITKLLGKLPNNMNEFNQLKKQKLDEIDQELNRLKGGR